MNIVAIGQNALGSREITTLTGGWRIVPARLADILGLKPGAVFV
uniref:Uncharacterized protein n=1 Tax=Candidatus Kentrum sp. LPFa TaxID=2126335 RepID=A0A450WXN4_9GAMM|nr:MAG: hypothetical protein BECKLPF1236B_GA0070989_12753 [Candidatus Kentron sp. LPFa]